MSLSIFSIVTILNGVNKIPHGAIFLSMIGKFPPMRTVILPAECDEDDLVVLDLMH